MIENRQVMAKNILHFMEINGVNATDVCKACGFKQNTFSDWVNGKTYPRIDKIETMANYFGISKALLVEERKNPIDTDEAKAIRDYYLKPTKEEITEAENAKRIEQALDFWDAYEKATPDERQIVDIALKRTLHKS